MSDIPSRMDITITYAGGRGGWCAYVFRRLMGTVYLLEGGGELMSDHSFSDEEIKIAYTETREEALGRAVIFLTKERIQERGRKKKRGGKKKEVGG